MVVGAGADILKIDIRQPLAGASLHDKSKPVVPLLTRAARSGGSGMTGMQLSLLREVTGALCFMFQGRLELGYGIFEMGHSN
jgi:hypothetical protein